MPNDEQIFKRHIKDLTIQSEKRQSSEFTNFLSTSEQALSEQILRAEKAEYSFFGGYKDAERKILRIGSDCDFPLEAVTFRYRTADSLSHRDFLGALIALGIKRELLGDICVGKGYAIVFCTASIVEMIISETSTIGKVGVKTEKGITLPLPEQKYSEYEAVVASLRLDCIVAAAAVLSREKAQKLIKSKLVMINNILCDEISQIVSENVKISVRGFGKYELSEIGLTSKKGKLHIKIKQFI